MSADAFIWMAIFGGFLIFLCFADFVVFAVMWVWGKIRNRR